VVKKIKMNIFYIHTDPVKAALDLADDHIRKMQIESAQMCCTAHWETGSQAPYKRAHWNHPSTIWARQSIQHYRWLVKHGLEICNEFIKRYGKHHKTQDVLEWLQQNEPNIPDNGFVEPPQCMPDEFKMKNTVEAYRNFYIKDKVKVKQLNWNKLNNKPEWIKKL
jgi:hypothetical protein